MTDAHEERELSVFRRFAEVCPLGIRPESIKKGEFPDISCEFEGEGSVGFELVEITDQTLARLTSEQIEFQRLLRETYRNLPDDDRAEVERAFGNALIGVRFHSDVSSRLKRNSIPLILDFLKEQKSLAGEELEPKPGSDLAKAVEKIRIIRRGSPGPRFHVSAATSYLDRTPESVLKKLNKQYQSQTPIDLLAYYEFQPPDPPDVFEARFSNFLEANSSRLEKFRRVWFFDALGKKILFVNR
ncbi:MAG: hypothetical protein ACE5JS_05775 [Nitrospinota bacterium]